MTHEEKLQEELLIAMQSCYSKLFERAQSLHVATGDPYGYMILSMNLKTGGHVFLSNINPPVCFTVMENFLKTHGYLTPPISVAKSLYPQMTQSQN